jgi:predicted DNA-binding protein (MmcQ/YjbR family)
MPVTSVALERVRTICLALPGTSEKKAWGEATFRVANRMFAMTDNNHHDAGRVAVWCKATILDQALLVAAQRKHCFVPPYVGVKGWVGVRVDGRPNWNLVTEMLVAAWRLTAPPKLVAALSAPEARRAPSGAGRASRRRPRGRTRGA